MASMLNPELSTIHTAQFTQQSMQVAGESNVMLARVECMQWSVQSFKQPVYASGITLLRKRHEQHFQESGLKSLERQTLKQPGHESGLMLFC